MNYSKAIRIARALSDMPQKELAEKISLDPSFISLLETGKRRPSLTTVEKIAEELQIPFHLLTLLAAEPEELQGISQEEISHLATGLTRLLLNGSADGPNRGKDRGTEIEYTKRGRAIRPSRHKSPQSR
jgi:transcriptional regulator with XRE-family HTH domain